MEDKLKAYGALGLGSRFIRLGSYLMRDVQLVYTEIGLDFDTFLFPVFKLIIDKEFITTGEIQESLQYTQPAITQAVNKLKEKQLVVITKDKTDARKKNISLSEQGKELQLKLQPVWQVISEEMNNLLERTSGDLLAQIHQLEQSFEEKDMSKRILSALKNK